MQEQLDALTAMLPQCMPADRGRLRRRLQGLRGRLRAGKPVDRALGELGEAVEASVRRLRLRREGLPQPAYPEELPVSAKRAAIAAAVEHNQVVVIAGETGSGKTTQIPKICLELGRGAAGLIGHTQPRRIAARSVAARIAAELDTPLGGAVGYKVRFSDRTGPGTYIKLMTDGMLLAEIQGDRLLEQYDTLIIDEAHERSLNIDFLLGYLRHLLPRRPDLKVIVTSATINTEAFSQFFDGAPVIEVSGRTYPVEMRYRPLTGADEDGRDRELRQAIVEGVDELAAIDPLGDILVFLSGEREIRETAEALHKHRLPHTEILPLFSRLSAAEQDRVFKSHPGRRIVLATNVAETSLTVPGIRFVIDPGFARISRYSHRTKVQRLPVEAISQASADQRAGRCGRVRAGVCIRLYSEEDYLGRPRFTTPEVRRTNLASVILQMSALGLGEVESYPFIDPPDRRYVSDGFRILHELGAADERRQLTDIGGRLARLPVDPRLGRMLLAADRERSLSEALVIAAALAVQDPRERPLEAQQQADTAQAVFQDERSDFLAFLKLWTLYHEQARHLTQRKLRQWCRDHFLSFMRMREWHDIHSQLLTVSREMGLRPNGEPAGYDAVHRALLTGLLGNVGVKAEEERPAGGKRGRGRTTAYTGARNITLHLFPGSALCKKPPKWIMAAELVETARLFGRTAAAIRPEWLEELAPHLLKRSYSEPHWEKRTAQVAAFERVTLYGLIVVGRRRVNYGPIDPETARELFIRHALVEGDFLTRAPFFAHNRRLVTELEDLEAKARRRDVLVDDQVLFGFYDTRVPEGIFNGASFEKWRAQAERDDPRLLFMDRDTLMRHGAEGVGEARFPPFIELGGLRLSLEYRFAPGDPADGVTAVVPVAALGQLRPEPFERLVPGLLEEKLTALIKTLPKSLRRNFVPAADFAAACAQTPSPGGGSLLEAVTAQLARMTGVEVPPDAWRPEALPDHLRMNVRVVDDQGKTLSEGRDLSALQQGLAVEARASLSGQPFGALEREGIIDWDFGPLPEEVSVERRGLTLRGYPALEDRGDSVALRIFEQPAAAERAMGAGLRRLFMLRLADKVKYLKKNLPGLQTMCLHYAALGACEQLKEDLAEAVFHRVFLGERPWPRTAEAFADRLEAGRGALVAAANALAQTAAGALAEFHAIARAVKGGVPPHRLHAAADILDQLDRLIHPGFLLHTPDPWLGHLPRYLKAVRLRLEKLDRAPERDRQQMQALLPLWRAYWERADALGPEEGPGPDLEEFRWSLEELRVSLFAQELRTAMAVSVQRLEKRRRELGL